ncbi:MAG: hypothetical protein RLZZ427_1555 [Pseudomonadota bacterium]|jgi:hypothetical protein
MMNQPKPFASLGPELLARKGRARPAMRPHLASLLEFRGDAVSDDLGWNDMGRESETGPAPVTALARAIAGGRRSALAEGRRCAFTLRLDAERHRNLRRACAQWNASAQQLITAALDRLLADQPPGATSTDQVSEGECP